MVSSRARRNLVLIAAVLLVSVMTGSTFAYVTQEKTVLNEYQTGKYSTEIQETFEPPSDWLPGQDVNKDVNIVNSGEVPVFVKVKIRQDWIRRENVYYADGTLVPPAKGEPFPLTFTPEGSGEQYAAQVAWGKDVVLLESGKTGVASLQLGLPTVSKPEDAAGKWLLLSETPDANGEYTFYYMGVLNSASSTSLLVDSVKLNPALEATERSETIRWKKDGGTWTQTTTTVANPTHAYECARYTMGVKMYTVQATEAALTEMFPAGTTGEQAVISCMQGFAVTGKGEDRSRDDSVTTKRLWIDEKDGKLTYTPVAGTIEKEDGWFMSHLNMLPGESYEDTMIIENLSKKKVKLYMKAVPIGQQKIPDELLGYIHMKVYHGDTLIYDGTALGKEYEGSIRNLQNAVSLGEYKSKAQKNIRVELTLDKDTPIEYAGIYSQIDWKFTTEEDTGSTPSTPSGPKTGDDSQPLLYTIIMTICGVLLVLCVWWLIRERKRSL